MKAIKCDQCGDFALKAMKIIATQEEICPWPVGPSKLYLMDFDLCSSCGKGLMQLIQKWQDDKYGAQGMGEEGLREG